MARTYSEDEMSKLEEQRDVAESKVEKLEAENRKLRDQLGIATSHPGGAVPTIPPRVLRIAKEIYETIQEEAAQMVNTPDFEDVVQEVDPETKMPVD